MLLLNTHKFNPYPCMIHIITFRTPRCHKLLIIFLLFWLAFAGKLKAQTNPTTQPPFLPVTSDWVDSVFRQLTLDEKIGQLLIVAAYSNKDKAHEDSIAALVKNYKIGGLIFMQGGPVRQARLANRYQSVAGVPLWIAMDLEWGLGMRLDSTINFPYQMALGAIQDNRLIYAMGAEVARQCKRMGIHVNFAPVADINNNPQNPVINFRSFGEEKIDVTQKSIAYMKGMQDHHILATAKHFPGHGDTDTDSHYDLPVINFNRNRLDSLELYPFNEMIKAGIGSIMTAHLSIPQLDSTVNLPSTLSKPVITDLLRNELNFKGIIFTDAMNMQGVTKYFPAGQADAMALAAGNDVLEFSKDIPKAIEEIKKAIRSGAISIAQIDASCKKVLAAKQWVGLDRYQPIALENLVEDLNNPQANLLNRQLTQASLTVLENKENILPLKNLKDLKVATLSIGVNELSQFQEILHRYKEADAFFLPKESTESMAKLMIEGLSDYDVVIVGIHQMGKRPYNSMRLSSHLLNMLQELTLHSKVVYALFSNPYLISKMPGIENAEALVVTYSESQLSQELAAQMIYGAEGADGKLPVSIEGKYKKGAGLDLAPIKRLSYSIPEGAGLNSTILSNIDSVVMEALEAKAIPGCQVLVARDGKVVFQKSYGFHTYDSAREVSNTDIYDLASLTKVSASLPAIMKLAQEGKLDLDGKLGDYLPYFKGSNKEDLTFRDMLTHQSGLQAWIPFWKNTIKKNGKFKWFTFKNKYSRRFPIKVAENLFLHRRYDRKILKAIKKSPVSVDKKYVYSDLSFILYPLIVERLTGESFEDYVQNNFYKPLGASTLQYNPFSKYDINRIVPTEYDSTFRKSLLHGRVDDEGAAMMEGVSGHAGLFGNANDLAKLMQLYLQKGTYGSQQIISEKVIDEFTRCQFCGTGNRRALGFDKPNIIRVPNGNAADSASNSSFGHSGFTGTFAWVDPAENLVYIFLSNRVNPTRLNNQLGELNIRTRLQQVIYDAIIEKNQD